MKIKPITSLWAGAVAAALLSGCATDPSSSDYAGSPGAGLGRPGDPYAQQGDVLLGTDADGALTVGDPFGPPEPPFGGPPQLRSNNTIYFQFNSEQLQDEYLGIMQSHAQYLRDNPDSRIIIEGHTDERGTPEYNIALGERRARSVAHFMQQLGVDVNQLSIVSYGEEKPAQPGHDESSWSRNRRAIINY